MEKPVFTEKEIEQLSDLHENWGYSVAIGEIQAYLKTLGYSDVNAVVIAIRKEFLKRDEARRLKYQETYEGSKLDDKLMARYIWSQEQKKEEL